MNHHSVTYALKKGGYAVSDAFYSLDIELTPSSILSVMVNINKYNRYGALLIIPSIGYPGVIICEPIIWIIMCVQLVYSFYSNPYIKEHKYIVNYEIERS